MYLYRLGLTIGDPTGTSVHTTPSTAVDSTSFENGYHPQPIGSEVVADPTRGEMR